MKRNTRKPAAPVAPTATFVDGARVCVEGSDDVGTVLSTEITPDDFGRDTHYEMVTVQWDDARFGAAQHHACNLVRADLTDAEKFQRECDDARAFARIHD